MGGRHTYRIIHIHKFAGRKTLPGVHLGKRSATGAGAGAGASGPSKASPGLARQVESSRVG